MNLDEALKIAGVDRLDEGPMMRDVKTPKNLKVKDLVGKYPDAAQAIRKAYALGLADGKEGAE